MVLATACTTTSTPSSSSSTTSTVTKSGPWKNPLRHPTIHLSADKPCPTSLGGARDIVNTGPGLTSHLLPGTPTKALVCLYSTRFERQWLLDAKQTRQLVSVIDHVRTAPPKGTFHCPADIPGNGVLVFRVPGRADIDLWWHNSGCQTLDNGIIGAFEGGNPSFSRFINAMHGLKSVATTGVVLGSAVKCAGGPQAPANAGVYISILHDLPNNHGTMVSRTLHGPWRFKYVLPAGRYEVAVLGGEFWTPFRVTAGLTVKVQVFCG